MSAKKARPITDASLIRRLARDERVTRLDFARVAHWAALRSNARYRLGLFKRTPRGRFAARRDLTQAERELNRALGGVVGKTFSEDPSR